MSIAEVEAAGGPDQRPANEVAAVAATTGRMRVMHVLNTLQTGGAEYLVLNIAKSHDRERFELLVCSLGGDGEIGDELRKLGIPVFVFNRRQGLDPLLVPKLVRLIRRERVKMVHSHNVAPWLYAGMAARMSMAGVQVCHTEHSNLFTEQKALKKAEKLLARMSKAVICDGEDVRRQLVDEQGLSPRNVVTILNGVDTALYARPVADRAKARKALGLADDTPVVATVARLEPVKDQATLLRAFEKVGAALPEARLVLVGDGSLRGDLEQQARRPDLAGRVIFLGRRADISDLLPLFDVFALTSVSEGLPLTVLEAMAAGLPCVATSVGAVPEAVIEGQTGMLVSPGDTDGLTAALTRLLRDPGLRRQMGVEAQKRARAHFDLRVMTRRYEDLYLA